MPKFKIEITQRFHVIRKITIEVEADHLDDAIEEVASGSIDAPDFDDPSWRTGWDLIDERATAD
jgi:hypothetical protein